jgi:crotonobetainyl-CoA:carnitine CoA-transferase CaiB-like acyl-CoA transferase
MTITTTREAEAQGPTEWAPLRDTRFVRLGNSLVGRLLTDLLAAQGAIESTVTLADVVIDDRTTDSTGRKSAMPPVKEAAIQLTYTDFPKGHPRAGGRIQLLDELVHAETGLNRMAGDSSRPEPLSIASGYAAIWGAIYIATALIRRTATGKGSAIELSLYAAAETVVARYQIVPADERLVDPVALPYLPLAEIYRCGDGRYVQSHGGFSNFAEAFCIAAGRPEWIRDAIEALKALPNRDSVAFWRERMSKVFLTRSAQEWEDVINAVGGACTLCRTREEWLATDHAYQTNILARRNSQKGQGGPVVSGVRVVTSDIAAPVREVPVSSTAGIGRDQPLAGVKVVDFCIILAGPTCGRTLAEMGAEVIRIDDANRPVSPYGALDVNRGKRSIALNLKSADGKEIARRLVADSNIVIENLRAGKLAQLGFGYDDVRKMVPDVVYASLNCFDFGGQWSERAGWEHNAQAATGMQLARAINGAAKAVPVPVNDYSTGLLGAYGVLLAYRHARSTGQSAIVTGSLARTASFIQTEELAVAAGMEEPRRNLATAAYRCSDGWIRILIQPGRKAEVEIILKDAADQPAESVLKRLADQGCYGVLERTVAEAACDPWFGTSGLQFTHDHPRWGKIKQSICLPTTADWTVSIGCPAPDPGEDSELILTNLGYSATEIARLIESGAVSRRVPIFTRI